MGYCIRVSGSYPGRTRWAHPGSVNVDSNSDAAGRLYSRRGVVARGIEMGSPLDCSDNRKSQVRGYCCSPRQSPHCRSRHVLGNSGHMRGNVPRSNMCTHTDQKCRSLKSDLPPHTNRCRCWHRARVDHFRCNGRQRGRSLGTRSGAAPPVCRRVVPGSAGCRGTESS
jgi:hypothetical protein